MSDESAAVRSVAWGEIFPWLLIPRSVVLASSVPVLLVATVGVLLMPLGWWGASYLLPEEDRLAAQAMQRSIEVQSVPPSLLPGNRRRPPVVKFELSDSYTPMVNTAGSLVDPLRQLLRLDVRWSEIGYWTMGGIWNLIVWGLLGGVITRMAVVRYGREEREGVVSAFRFVGRRYHAFVGAPLFALTGVLIVLFCSIPVGWLLRWDVGVMLVACIWFFVLLGGIVTTLFLIGLLFGWPLMWGALSAEEMGDVYEGAQRTYAYLYSRPLHYVFYALVTVVVGSLTYCVASWLGHSVISASVWAVAWGAGTEQLTSMSHNGSVAALGTGIINWFNGLVLTVTVAFCYSFLFTAAGVVYLLIRRDCDQIEFDNVSMPSQQVRFGLPPLTTDEAGVPGVAEDTP